MHSFQFIQTFFTSPKLSRLRVFIMWSLLCSTPTIYIVGVTLQTQVYVPGMPGTDLIQYFISMASGIFVVPLLFTITNGLRGYHILFSKLLGNLGYFFVPKSQEELAEELGPLLPEKVMQMEQTATILGFLTLEFIIIGWDLVIYFLFNGSMSGLSLLGFMSDNLLIAAFIFLLEATNVVVVGSKSFLQLHTLKATTILKLKQKENSNV